MTIGYWSEIPGKGASTFNMIAMALSMVQKCQKRVVLMQGKFDHQRVDYAFTPFMEENMMREDYGYYHYGGMDNVLNRLENHRLSRTELEKEFVRVGDSTVYYLPATRQRVKELFDRRFLKVEREYLRVLKEFDRDTVIFVELDSGPCHVTEENLKELDGLVINIPQEQQAVGSIKERRAVMENALFMIGMYDDASRFSVGNIYRRYHIDRESIGVVPYCVPFKDAVMLGRSREFFLKKPHSEKEKMASPFWRYLDSTTDRFMKRWKIDIYR